MNIYNKYFGFDPVSAEENPPISHHGIFRTHDIMPLSQVLPAVNEEAQFGEKLREFWTTDWSDWAAWLYAMLDVTYRNIPPSLCRFRHFARFSGGDFAGWLSDGAERQQLAVDHHEVSKGLGQSCSVLAGLVKSCYRCCQVLEKSVASEHLGAPVLVMSRPV